MQGKGTMLKPVNDSDSWTSRIGLSIYAAVTLCAILSSKLCFQNQIIGLLANEDIRPEFSPGPLHAIGPYVFLFSLPLLLLVLLLPRIAANLKCDSARSRSLLHSALFWAISILCWLSIDYDYMYLFYLGLYGGFLGIVEGVWSIPVRPRILDAVDLSNEAKRQLSTYHVDKWWRGLSLLWATVIAIAITAAISWAGTSPVPPDAVSHSQLSQAELWKVRKLLLLIIPALPGMAILAWYVVRKTNSVYDRLIQLNRTIY